MPSRARTLLTALVLTVGLLCAPSVALADALVVVRVQGENAPDGRVVLTARAGGGTFSCQTDEGTCRINGVPGGSYRVEFQPENGESASPRTAMIPPSGTVTLFVSAPAPD